MNWTLGQVQNNLGLTQRTWSDRPRLEDSTWTVRGVPIEVQVDLANEIGADPWINVPHLVDDAYVRAAEQGVISFDDLYFHGLVIAARTDMIGSILKGSMTGMPTPENAAATAKAGLRFYKFDPNEVIGQLMRMDARTISDRYETIDRAVRSFSREHPPKS